MQRRLSAASGGNMVGCELMCDQLVALAEQHVAGCALPFSARRDWYLLVELATSAHGDWLAPILTAVVAKAIRQGTAAAAVMAGDDAEMTALWHLRESLPSARSPQGHRSSTTLHYRCPGYPNFWRGRWRLSWTRCRGCGPVLADMSVTAIRTSI